MKVADKTKEAASWVSGKAKEAGTWIDDKVKSAWDNIFQSNNNDKLKGKLGEIKKNGKQETKIGRMVELSRNGIILIMEILSFILILMIMILHGMKRVILFIVIQLIILMMRLHLNRC